MFLLPLLITEKKSLIDISTSYFTHPFLSLIVLADERYAEMKASASKKNKSVEKAAALATIVIKKGKLLLPKHGEKRKFSMGASP